MTTPLSRLRRTLFIGGLTVAAVPAWAQAPAAQTAFDCRAGETPGVPPVDASTTVSIVCAELDRVSQRQGSFTVSIRPLGDALILSVTRLPKGDTRTLTLTGLSETPTAATRLADALLLGQPIEKTQRVDNLLVAETRQPNEKKGSRKFVLGVTGLNAAGQPGTGFVFGMAHEGPRWAVLTEIRFAGSSDDGQDLSLFAIGAGTRRYLSRQDISPFVGGGMERLSLTHGWLRATSLAPYVEVGVQAMRLSRARSTVGLRVHLPTSAIEGETYYSSNCSGPYSACDTPQRSSEYVVPITLDLAVSF